MYVALCWTLTDLFKFRFLTPKSLVVGKVFRLSVKKIKFSGVGSHDSDTANHSLLSAAKTQEVAWAVWGLLLVPHVPPPETGLCLPQQNLLCAGAWMI